MATPTLSERFSTALRARGWVEQAPLSGCRVFRHPDRRPAVFIYVGKGGSLRVGSTRTSSRVVADSLRDKLLAEATPARGGLTLNLEDF